MSQLNHPAAAVPAFSTVSRQQMVGVCTFGGGEPPDWSVKKCQGVIAISRRLIPAEALSQIVTQGFSAMIHSRKPWRTVHRDRMKTGRASRAAVSLLRGHGGKRQRTLTL